MNVGRAGIGRKLDEDVDVTQLWTEALYGKRESKSDVDGRDHVTDEFLSMIRMLDEMQLQTDAISQDLRLR